MADIQLTQQTANDDNWAYQVTINGQHNYNVTLSQSDYQQWTSGNTPPDRVIEAAFEFLLDREPPTSILSQFDCSVIRRYFPDVDQKLPKKL